MSKHIFTPRGNTPLVVNAANGGLKFVFPSPETFTLQLAPKDVPAANTGSSAIPGAPPVSTKDSSPFLQKQ